MPLPHDRRMQTSSPSVAQSRDILQGRIWHAHQCDTGCPVLLRPCVPGCRYDDGCTGVTNIDFSKGVIKEMMLKNLRQRPLMKWQVMDMTQTKASPSASPCQTITANPKVLSILLALPAELPLALVNKERANV